MSSAIKASQFSSTIPRIDKGQVFPRHIGQMVHLLHRCGCFVCHPILWEEDKAAMAHLIAASDEVVLDTLKKMRVRCIRDAKERNGEVDFEDACKFQKRLD